MQAPVLTGLSETHDALKERRLAERLYMFTALKPV